MKLRMGKREDESAEQPTGKQVSSNDEENLDKTESEVNGEENPQSATESTPTGEGKKSEDTKVNVDNIRKVIKLGSSEETAVETEKSETSDEKIEETPKENAVPSPTMDSATEQESATLQNIKDFDFQIKKNQDGLTNLNEKLDAVTSDLDDLVSLYEIVSEQMNPFVGLSKVTKKRIDALENFTREVETLKTRIGDLESFVERAGADLEGGLKQTSKLADEGYSKNVPEKLIEGAIDLDNIVEESLNALTSDEKIDLIIDEFIESLN